MANRLSKAIIPLAELEGLLNTAYSSNELSTALDRHFILVDITNWNKAGKTSATEQWQPNCPIIAVAEDDSDLPPMVDLVAGTDAELDMLTRAITDNPVASTMLVHLLRSNERSTTENALMAESLSYSCLQNGASFKNWLKQKKSGTKLLADKSPPLLLERENNILNIIFNRENKRNAYSALLRDAFYEALVLVEEDKTIETALISGLGECFSAGGDLDEFGSSTDSALAHIVRMTRNNGRLIDRLKSRIVFNLHGACIGAGIELPAFSNRVTARRDSFFQLPEVAMGLIPGAGGTVSIPRRIGRLRTAFMAISNQKIYAERALTWGLIDEING